MSNETKNNCCADGRYASIQQAYKKEPGEERKPVSFTTPIQAVYDGKTGASLEAILAQFNAIYVQYQGTPEATRNIIPEVMRRAGLTITYMDMESNTITERANSTVQKENDHWGLDVNWSRVDELSLSGDISVSATGTWIINGKDTGVKALGPKGDTGLTPWLKTIDNKLHFSYDNVTWEPCSENIVHWFRVEGNKLQISSDKTNWETVSDYIAAYFRFNATSSDSQSGTIGRIQISRDNKTWTDLSPEFRNYLRIQGYVSTTSALPKNQVVGTIYGVGPTYAAEDTEHTNPIYRLHVWNGTSWVDNGQFTSIAAGVVQETGESETEVMSQKAVTDRLVDIGAFTGDPVIIKNKLYSFSGGTGSIMSDENYDCVIVPILEGSSRITVKNGTPSYFIFFDTDTIESTYISYNKTGAIPDNAKSCIIDFPKSSNLEGLDALHITQDGGGATRESVHEISLPLQSVIKESYIDNNHLWNKSGDYISYDYNASWDAIWAYLLKETTEVSTVGFNSGTFHFFNDIKPSKDTFIASNKTGEVPSGARLVVHNLLKSSHPDGYDGYRIKQNGEFVITELLKNYIFNIPTGKNYIDANNTLNGYYLSGGQLVAGPNGKLSNKLYLEEGKTYTMQGILHYGTKLKSYLVHFDKEDNYIGYTNYVSTSYDPETTLGTATFTFYPIDGTAYSRIVLQTTSSSTFKSELAQLEDGDVATEVEPYVGKEEFKVIEQNKIYNKAIKKVVRILSIGNSYSEDSLSYVPYILKNMGVEVDIQIGILMLSSSSLTHHIDNFNNENAAYQFYINTGRAWQRTPAGENVTIQWALDNYKWDMIFPIGFGTGDYVANMNTLINLVSSYVDYPIKWGVQVGYVRPSRANTGVDPTTTSYTEEEMTQRYEEQLDKSKNLMENTVCEIIVPIATAIKNACSVPNIKVLGDFSNFEGNNLPTINDVHPGYLAYSDGVHLQEGLPCQIAAYTFVRVLLDYYGYKEISIIGESTRITSDWISGKNIPHTHGTPIGSTDENCLIIQKSVVMAVKNPYQIIDMVEKRLV